MNFIIYHGTRRLRRLLLVGDHGTLDPHLLNASRHLGHGLLHSPGHDCAIDVAGAGQDQQQLQRLGAGGGLQHVEAVQQHLAVSDSRAMAIASRVPARHFSDPGSET